MFSHCAKYFTVDTPLICWGKCTFIYIYINIQNILEIKYKYINISLSICIWVSIYLFIESEIYVQLFQASIIPREACSHTRFL